MADGRDVKDGLDDGRGVTVGNIVGNADGTSDGAFEVDGGRLDIMLGFFVASGEGGALGNELAEKKSEVGSIDAVGSFVVKAIGSFDCRDSIAGNEPGIIEDGDNVAAAFVAIVGGSLISEDETYEISATTQGTHFMFVLFGHCGCISFESVRLTSKTRFILASLSFLLIDGVLDLIVRSLLLMFGGIS